MGVSLSDPSVVVAMKEHVSCPLGDDVVILNLKAGLYFSLGNVGAKVWELIQQPTTVGAVRRAILEAFEVAPDVCERDLRALLHELADRNLIEVRDAVAV